MEVRRSSYLQDVFIQQAGEQRGARGLHANQLREETWSESDEDRGVYVSDSVRRMRELFHLPSIPEDIFEENPKEFFRRMLDR